MPNANKNSHTVVVGGGFTGLAAAYELTKQGISVTVIESEKVLGGLASGFDIGGQTLERFYHHWFTNDKYVMDLIRELGAEENIILRPTRTGMYYAKNFYRLSQPIDLLRFKPLNLIDRLRLGWATIKVRSIKNWLDLEGLTAREWLIDVFGKNVYRVVWEPLLVGKFGPFAESVSAVWFWKKLVLRGGSRGSGGKEVLAYYRGGFTALAECIGKAIEDAGGRVILGTKVLGVQTEHGHVTAVETDGGVIGADALLVTTPLPITADILNGAVEQEYLNQLRRINYLANVCLVLELDRSLSETYWLNVNDPGFPFVGIIEHTNFEPPQSYGGKHIVYLSKYLVATDPMYSMSADGLLEFALPHIQRMFPEFKREWIKGYHVWHADYAQPIAERYYSKLLPEIKTPLSNVYISSMAHVYPEDRGTNYAIRDGRAVAKLIMKNSTL